MRDVAGLLAVEIIELVFLANLIAWSVFYYFMNNWLGHFACRTKINIVTFVVVGIMTLVIALATVSFHTVRSALDKFADCFRTE